MLKMLSQNPSSTQAEVRQGTRSCFFFCVHAHTGAHCRRTCAFHTVQAHLLYIVDPSFCLADGLGMVLRCSLCCVFDGWAGWHLTCAWWALVRHPYPRFPLVLQRLPCLF